MQFKHVPLLSLFFSILDLPAISPFFTSFFFRLSVFLSSLQVLYLFSWNKAFYFLRVIKNRILCFFLTFSVCLAITELLGWEKCVYLFSDLVCVDAVVPGFSSRTHGVISAAWRLNVWWFVSLCSWPIYLDPALLHCCYLEVLALQMIFSSNASNRHLSACSASFFLLSWAMLEIDFPQFLQTFCMLWSCSSHQELFVWFQLVFFCMYISEWAGIYLKQRRRTRLLWTLFQGLYQLNTHFFLPIEC